MRACFPEVRRSSLFALAMACALSIQQADAQALPPAVFACMNEQDAAQRLACYDREVPRALAAATRSPGASGAARAPGAAPMPSNASAPAQSAARSPTGAESAQSEVDAFGMTAQIQQKEVGGAKPSHLDKLTAHITGVSQKPRGESVVTLDNGQVWEESEATSHLPLRVGDDIIIKRGMLGAFYMSSKQALGLRVKRVQ
jgi:hypothetical protein